MPASLRVEFFPPDLDAFVDFWTRVARFKLVRDEREQGYVSVQRDAVHIGAASAWADTDPTLRLPPQGTEIVIEVDNVWSERDAVVAAEWPLFEDLVDRPWGLTDFRVLDPDGNFVRFTNR
jgi:catechol 2,3-dioxygenase-like lactoylglutathione lyase family enzyme